MIHAGKLLPCLALLIVGAALTNCSSSSGGSSSGDKGDDDDDSCFPDNDGVTGNTDGTYNFVLTVNDTGFSKMLLTTQNSAMVTVMLTNTGTTPHGFKVGCTSVTPAYPTVPAGCPMTACFDPSASIAPLDPGKSATIMFETPVPDNLIYPFTSNEPADSAVPGLNTGQWSLM
ncbi:MAG TPA: hypothetical protein VK762_01995 [Polyangiaceae bacterium]|jgi:hypothetical protein|nr:hypothetical protein [Polyangiaceae bacterium]